MGRQLAAPTTDARSVRRDQKVDRERHRKLRQLRLEGCEPFPDVHLPSRSLAAEIYASHDPRTLEPGEHVAWRYVVAGRLLARRKHRHATFLDLRDQSGVIELCARRDALDHAQHSRLLGADIGDIIAAEGTIYVTDNHKLALSVLSSKLLTKALRAPPAWNDGTTTIETRHRRRELDLLANEQTRMLFKIRSSTSSAVREWMTQNLFIEVEGPTHRSFADGTATTPFVADPEALGRDLASRVSNRLYFRRCLLGGLERVYLLGKGFQGDVPQDRGTERTMLEWSAAYIDYRAAARQAQEVVLRVASAVAPDMRVLWHGDSIDVGVPWRTTTVREGIAEQCGIDILAADLATLARHLPRRPSADEDSWGSLVNELYTTFVEPKLVQPTIVYDFPLACQALVKRHPAYDELAGSFRVVIGGIQMVSGDSELNDPYEQSARLTAQQGSAPDESPATRNYRDQEVRLLEYGLCPAAGARLDVDRLLVLLTESDTLRDVVPLPLLASTE